MYFKLSNVILPWKFIITLFHDSIALGELVLKTVLVDFSKMKGTGARINFNIY